MNQSAWGGRQHYLRWKNPDTWQYWQDVGLSYDSTLAYAQEIGFRSGCCYEHSVFNLSTRQSLKLRERPLVAMDATLLTYMEYSLEKAEHSLKDLIQVCRRYNGDFTLLWHPNWLVGAAMRLAYTRIVGAAA